MADKTLGQAVELVKGLEKSYRAVLAVGDVLKNLNDLETEKRRLERFIEGLNKDKKRHEDETNGALHNLQEMQRQLTDSKKEAKNLLIDTKVQVDETMRNGKRVAKNLVDDAKDIVKKQLEGMEKTNKIFKDEMAVMQATKKTLQNEIHILDVELAKMKERLGF